MSYNFLIVDSTLASPNSSLDTLNGVVEFEDVSNSVTAHSGGPIVAVKVVDKEAKGESSAKYDRLCTDDGTA